MGEKPTKGITMTDKTKSEALDDAELDQVRGSGGDGVTESVWIDPGFAIKTPQTPPQQIGGDPDQPVIVGRIYNGQ